MKRTEYKSDAKRVRVALMVLAQTFYPHLLTWFQEAMVATKSKDRVEALHKMEEQLTKKERQEFFKRCYDSHEEEFVRTVEDGGVRVVDYIYTAAVNAG